MSGIASWQLMDWFGEINGVKNVSKYDAEAVTIHTGNNVPIEVDYVPSDGEVPFRCENNYISISWLDGAGMHADVVRLED